MRVIVEYFGLLIFGFVVFVGGLVALFELSVPEISPGEMGGLILALDVIVGGFSWYYNADLPAGSATPYRWSPNSPSSRG